MRRTNLQIWLILTVLAVLCLGINSALAGTLVGWGQIAFNSDDLMSRNFVTISAGWASRLALKADGSIVCWGNNERGQVTGTSGSDYVAI